MPVTNYMNTFVWVGLTTSEQEAAKDFYATLFDWSYSEQSIDGGRVYSTAVVKGNQVAGIHARGDEEQRKPPNGPVTSRSTTSMTRQRRQSQSVEAG